MFVLCADISCQSWQRDIAKVAIAKVDRERHGHECYYVGEGVRQRKAEIDI